MKINLFEQRTPQWYLARAGKFTASEVGPFVVNSGAVAEKARKGLVRKKLAESLGHTIEGYVSDAMKAGSALEGIVRSNYRAMLKLPTIDVGFISHDTLPLGCSPDDVVLSRDLEEGDTEATIEKLICGGCEIKSPEGHTQLRYLEEGILPEEYKFQVHHSMAISGTEWWDFYSGARLVTEWEKTREAWTAITWGTSAIPDFYIRTHRNAFTAELEQGLRSLAHDLAQRKAWLASLKSA